ncbi:hypothetical protein [Actinomadura keratinilytica]|uniref:hypothetical protein n=1 Tax=Actinomadura keratinilytica TaxID=547461 RepID=UPI003623267F
MRVETAPVRGQPGAFGDGVPDQAEDAFAGVGDAETQVRLMVAGTLVRDDADTGRSGLRRQQEQFHRPIRRRPHLRYHDRQLLSRNPVTLRQMTADDRAGNGRRRRQPALLQFRQCRVDASGKDEQGPVIEPSVPGE